MAEVVAGAVLGVAIQQLYSAIENAISSASRFKDLLQKLKDTVNALGPKIKQFDELIQSFDDNYAKQKIQPFILQLNKAEWLVSRCSEIKKRNVLKKRKCKKIMRKLDESLNKILRTDLPHLERETMLRLLGEILENNKKLDQHVVETTEDPGNASRGNSSGHRCGRFEWK